MDEMIEQIMELIEEATDNAYRNLPRRDVVPPSAHVVRWR